MDKINTNCLSGYRCSSCRSQGPFKMTVITMALMTDDGNEDTCGDTEYMDGGQMQCQACWHMGTLEEFDIQKRYVAGGGTHCPYCGSDQIEGQSFDVEDGKVYQEVVCVVCSAQWQNQYTLTGIGDFPDHEFVHNHNEAIK